MRARIGCAALLAGFGLLAGAVSPPGTSTAALAAQSRPGAAPHGIPRTIAFREDAVHGKTVATAAGERTQILFGDGTTITLAPDTAIRIESYRFEPASGSATLAATLTRGAVRFIGGRTARTPGGVSFATPLGTLALQSTGASLSLGDAAAPAHFDLLFAGSMSLTRGSAVIARVRKQGYSIVPDGSGRSAAVRKTPAEWLNAGQDVPLATRQGR